MKPISTSMSRFNYLYRLNLSKQRQSDGVIYYKFSLNFISSPLALYLRHNYFYKRFYLYLCGFVLLSIFICGVLFSLLIEVAFPKLVLEIAFDSKILMTVTIDLKLQTKFSFPAKSLQPKKLDTSSPDSDVIKLFHQFLLHATDLLLGFEVQSTFLVSVSCHSDFIRITLPQCRYDVKARSFHAMILILYRFLFSALQKASQSPVPPLVTASLKIPSVAMDISLHYFPSALFLYFTYLWQFFRESTWIPYLYFITINTVIDKVTFRLMKSHYNFFFRLHSLRLLWEPPNCLLVVNSLCGRFFQREDSFQIQNLRIVLHGGNKTRGFPSLEDFEAVFLAGNCNLYVISLVRAIKLVYSEKFFERKRNELLFIE